MSALDTPTLNSIHPVPLFHLLPCVSLVLYQVIGVLISGHRGCRVTDGPAGIMWSICIIGVLALFISLPVCLSRQHPCSRTYSHMCARTHSKDTWLFLSPFVCKRTGDIFSPGWAACALIDHMEMEIGRSSFWVMRIGAYLGFESLNQFGERRENECCLHQPRGAGVHRGPLFNIGLFCSPYLTGEGHSDDSGEAWVCAQSAKLSRKHIFMYFSPSKKRVKLQGSFWYSTTTRAMTFFLFEQLLSVFCSALILWKHKL